VPISGVLSGAAAPISTTIALPPGFLCTGISFQLLASHTLPDGSIATARCSDQVVGRVAGSVGRDRHAHDLLGQRAFRGFDAAEMADPIELLPALGMIGIAQVEGEPKFATHTVSLPSTAIPPSNDRPPPVNGEARSGWRSGSWW
jgi:hypothetical protein